jgi:tetratricopeptide (TPR) repeat protein
VNLKTRGPDHPNTSATIHALALIAAARGDYRSAESELRRVLEIDRRALGERHPVVAMTLNNLARTLSRQDRHADAAAALLQALDIARATLGPGHQLVAIYTINLAAERLALHEPAAADALLREGLAIRRHAPGIVPTRRRTFAEDDWSLDATRQLLDTAAPRRRASAACRLSRSESDSPGRKRRIDMHYLGLLATSVALSVTPPAVPTDLQVDAAYKPFLIARASGTQNYICLPSAAGVAWTLFGPQATLFDDDQRQVITHFLSANPGENGTLRPTWQHSRDTSAVWAAAEATSSDAAYVPPGAIPC